MTAGKNEGGVAGYILAGGGSTRFGRDKAVVEFDGQPMLARMMKLMRGLQGKLPFGGMGGGGMPPGMPF